MRVWVTANKTVPLPLGDELTHVDEGIYVHIEYGHHLVIPLGEAIGLDIAIREAIEVATKLRKDTEL